jgi:hypothetical protein
MTHFDFDQYTVGPRDHEAMVELIKTRIEQLAAGERLLKLDKKFKSHFHDCFPSDIPHVNHLPTDVYHHITLKSDSNFVGTSRPYTCPRKYCEA